MAAGETGTTSGAAVGHVLPDGARCRKCGYLLRGLPGTICPECGSAFDPADRKTYALTTPEQRRRKLYVRCAAIVALALLIWALAPRGKLEADITIGCRTCGQAVTMRRMELIAPRWFPWRYPGWIMSTQWWTMATGPPVYATWTDSFSGAKPTTAPASCKHNWDFVGLVYPRGRGRSIEYAEGNGAGINGRRVKPENLGMLLREAVDPRPSKWPVLAPNCPPDPATPP